MVPEAPLERVENGIRPSGAGWFVVNARAVPWFDTGGSGFYALFDSAAARFDQLGIAIGILRAGEPNALYHGEDAEEDFLVLSGECLLVIEGEERRLRAWDFVHCPPWAEHVFVGAGDGPCIVLAVGARRKGRGIRFPVDELALAHGAGVEQEATDPAEAYAGFPDEKPVPCPPEFLTSGRVFGETD